MNSKALLIILFISLGVFAVYKVTSSKTSMQEESPQLTEEIVSMMDEDKDEQESLMMDDRPEGASVFEISQGSTASYVAQKRFLSKEDVEVVGTTDNITGKGWIDFSTNSMYMSASIGLSGLKTDSSKRDSDIQAFFNPNIASVMFKADNLPEGLSTGKTVTMTANTQLTINNITKEVPFEIEVTVGDTSAIASGAAQIKMSDFGINPPSLLNVYTVDDEIGLEFNVSGQRI